jgi:hypothetical protein
MFVNLVRTHHFGNEKFKMKEVQNGIYNTFPWERRGIMSAGNAKKPILFKFLKNKGAQTEPNALVRS